MTTARRSRASALIEMIRSDIDSGYGIVPVLGSGISAQSGIPAGVDYQAYLFYCVTRLFDITPTSGSDRVPKWDPSSLRWPPYTTVPAYEDLSDEMVRWTQKWSAKLKSDSASAATQRAVWQSLGAVADWRAMLHLLSRIHVDRSGTVLVKEPEPKIIDSFFINLTEGKRPNTAHMLLAHLADVLRLKVILTTNFDTLLEAAFRQLEMPVATFDVHYDAGFPDGRFARAQRSIVKINGGRYGLRADFTLDRLPDAADFENFISYLTPLVSTFPSPGPPERHDADANTPPPHQRNLLVMGVSGQERRTIALICQAMLSRPGLKTYWVCHQPSEIDGVHSAFSTVSDTLYDRTQSKPPSTASQLLERLSIAAAPDVGLFLLHLYQRMFLCLPPSGVPFKAIWPLPPPPYEIAREDCKPPHADKAVSAQLRTGSQQLTQAIAKPEKDGEAPSPSRNRLFFVIGESGVPSVASHVFLEPTDDRHRIWVDIDEGSRSVDIATAVLDAARQRVGIADPLLFSLKESSVSNPSKFVTVFRDQFSRLRRYSRRHFLVFINGRECPGRRTDRTGDDAVHDVLVWLKDEETVTTVVLGWESDNWTKELRGLDLQTIKLPPLFGGRPDDTVDRLVDLVRNCRSGREQTRLARFLAVLSLFRRPCYLSATNAWPLVGLSTEPGETTPSPEVGDSCAREEDLIDKDQRRFEYVLLGDKKAGREAYLDLLRKVGAIRDDDGQTVFMHRSVRTRLREKLEVEKMCSQGWEVKAHQGIADWYLKLYRASGDVAAAIESLHHRVQCIDSAVKHNLPYMRESAATEARVTLRLMRPTLALSVVQPHMWQYWLELHCKKLEDLTKTVNKGQDREALTKTDHKDAGAATMMDCSPNLATTAKEARHQLDELNSQWKPPSFPVRPPRVGVARDLQNLDSLEDIRRLIYARNYRQAEEQISRRFEEIGFGDKEKLANDQGTSGTIRYDKCRISARDWVTKVRFDQETIGNAVHILRQFHTLRLLRAELYARLRRSNGRRDALVGAEAIYVYATELMRNIDDVRFLQNENAFLRANQGLVLSWMNRPREAHRRYNEAYGYLNQLETPPMSLRFAAIDGRRAQTFLFAVRAAADEANQGTGAERIDARRRARGSLYDAIAAVERATYKSVEQRYPVWHSYLAELTMEVCCEIARQGPEAEDLYARARDRSGCGEWFYSCLEAGFFSVGDDPVRLHRFVELALTFNHRNRHSPMGHISDDCLRRIEDLQNDCKARMDSITDLGDAEVRQYAQSKCVVCP